MNLALHQAYTIHLHSKGPSWPIHTPPIIFFSVLSTCHLPLLISQQCLPSSPICNVYRWAPLPFLPCQPSCMEEALINISKPTSLFSLKCLQKCLLSCDSYRKTLDSKYNDFFYSHYSYLIISLCFPACLVRLSAISCLRLEAAKGRNWIFVLYLHSAEHNRFLSITGLLYHYCSINDNFWTQL